jgi:glutathione S-transferase
MTNLNPYQLFLSQRSPFARRIRLALKRLDLPFEERVVNVFEENPDLLAANPLGMVPALLTPDGLSLFDSAMILEYLHDVSGGIWPSSTREKLIVRQTAALAAGLIQSTVAFFQETAMHEAPSPMWAKDHYLTVVNTLREMERTPEIFWLRDGKLTQAGWDLAVAIDYLEIRIPDLSLAEPYPSLIKLHALANQDAQFRETKPKL